MFKRGDGKALGETWQADSLEELASGAVCDWLLWGGSLWCPSQPGLTPLETDKEADKERTNTRIGSKPALKPGLNQSEPECILASLLWSNAWNAAIQKIKHEGARSRRGGRTCLENLTDQPSCSASLRSENSFLASDSAAIFLNAAPFEVPARDGQKQRAVTHFAGLLNELNAYLGFRLAPALQALGCRHASRAKNPIARFGQNSEE
jgi:hypothetical protein